MTQQRVAMNDQLLNFYELKCKSKVTWEEIYALKPVTRYA